MSNKGVFSFIIFSQLQNFHRLVIWCFWMMGYTKREHWSLAITNSCFQGVPKMVANLLPLCARCTCKQSLDTKIFVFICQAKSLVRIQRFPLLIRNSYYEKKSTIRHVRQHGFMHGDWLMMTSSTDMAACCFSLVWYPAHQA